MCPYIINTKNHTVTVVFSNGPRQFNLNTKNGEIVINGLKNKLSESEIIEELSETDNIQSYVNSSDYASRVLVKDNQVYIDNELLPKCLGDRLIEFMKHGIPLDHMVRFFDNLIKNPSHNSIQELYKFLENNDLVITEDGHFLAYKSVRDTYMDWHSNSYNNSPGNRVWMPRNKVDDDRRKNCSNGLHVGAISYVSNFHNNGKNKIVIVKVNPEHVVSVPEYDCTKCRVCEYVVLKDMSSVLNQSPLYTSNGEPFKCGGYDADFDFADDIDYSENNDVYNYDDDDYDDDYDDDDDYYYVEEIRL